MLKEEKLAQDNKQTQMAQSAAQEYFDMQRVLHEINIELFGIDDLDELYRTAVELAHTRLGFERVGLYLLNESSDLLLGTYGVDAEGNIRKEQGPEYVIDQKETIDTFVLNRTRLVVDEDIDLWDEGEVVGRGWHIGAALWTEDSPIGVIFADNLLNGQSLKPYQSELLFAYAGIVSNLIERNRFETIITKRAVEMQAVAEVGTAAATILDTDKLLQEVVDLTKNRFDLYHAHIYLLDTTTETLALTSGAGKIGQQMVAEGRQIPLKQEQSLVARAARSRHGVVINDVQSEPGFLPHPLLPDTHSEMAVPLITGDQVLGVLDVQSDRLNYFSKEDISTFTTLAAQMAVALQNARLFTESEKRASELAFISRIVTEINAVDVETGLQFMVEELGEILQVPLINVRLIDDTGTMLKVVAAIHPADSPSPVGTVFPIGQDPINDALQNRQTVIIEDVANSDIPPHIQKRILESGICSVYMIPMVVGRDLIGSVAINIPEGGSVLTPAQLRLVETTIQQAATAVQNTRLFSKSEERAEELAFVNKIVAEVSASLDIEQSLQIVADELAKVVELDGIGIALLNDDKTSLTVVAEKYSSEQAASILGYTYPVAGNPVTQKAFSTRNTVLVEDAQNHPLTEPIHAGLRMRGVNTMYVIPMFAGNEIVGTVGFDSKEKGRLMSPQQLRLVETIVYQVATAVQNARLFAQTEERETLLRTIIDATPDWIFIKDQEHRYRLVNQGYANALHITPKDFIGKNDLELGFPEELVKGDPEKGIRGFWTDDKLVMDSGEMQVYPDDPATIDGEVHTFHTIKAPLRDADEQVWGVLAFARDITEREQAEEALRRSEADLSEALKIAKLGYWEYDAEKDLFTFNDQFYALFHTTAEEHGGYQLSSAYYSQHFVYPDDLPMVGAEIERALSSTGQHYNRALEHRILYADGGVGHISVSINVDRDEDSNILRVYGANQDITERVQAEEALRDSEAQLSEALKIAKLAHWEYDVEKDLFTFNDQFFALFHTTAEEHGGHQLSSAYYAQHFVHPDDLPIVGAEIERALNSTDRHYSRSLEHRILYADGGVGYVSVSINIDRDEQGNILRYYGANQDITGHKEAEEALRHSEAELSETLKIAKLAYWEYDVEKDLFTFNDQFFALFHTTAEEHGGYQLSSAYYAQHFVHPDYRPDFSLSIPIEEALKSTEKHYSHSLVHGILYADGSPGYVLVNINIDRDEQGNVLRYYGANQDVTERVQAEEALRRSEAELSEALKIAKLAYWEYDIEKDMYFFNDQFFALLHTTAEAHGGYEMPGAYYAQHFIHPDDLPVVGAEIDKALSSPEQHHVISLEHRILYADGGIGYISVNMNVDRDEEGNNLRVYGANQDITERKLFEEAIQKEQERVQILLESINVPFAVTMVSDGNVIYCNEALGDLLGVSHEKLVGQGMPDFYANPSDREAYTSQLREQGFVNNFDLHMKRTDGQLIWALLSGRLMEFQGEPAIITFALDVTERREAQATIARRATELETVADVSAVAATILEPEELLQQVVDLTKERFDLYHAHIYLLDTDMGQLTLSNGAGEVGRTMVAEGRQIALSRKKSLVARAARDKKGVVINDVQAESGFLPNPLLPETRAEMAVPLLARDEVLGVLDVQADSINRFGEEDVNIFTTLAAQIAIALQNARFLNQSEKAVKELQELSRRLTREGWQDYFTQRKDRLAFSYDQQQEVPVLEAGPELAVFPEDAKLVAQPLQIQGASVGQLRLEISEEYGEDESELLTAVTERLSAHLENLRLAEVSEKDRAAAEKRSQEMAVINNIVTQISTSLDLQHSLQIVVDELVTAVNVDQARVALIQPDKKEMLVIAEHYDAARATSAVGMAIPLEGNELTQRVIDTRRMVVVEDAQNNPETAPVHDLFREQGIQTVVLMPLVVNDEVIGTLGMDILDDRPIQEDGLKLAETIVFQTATAIQNARLFEQVQATLAETEMLYSYSSQLNTATSLDAVLDSAAAAGFQVGATEALLLVYDRNTSGNPEYGQIAAIAPRDKERVGEILYLQELPTRYLWPASGQNTVFVGDVSADDRLSPEDKKVFTRQGAEALGIMYLNVGNLRLGQIIIYWDKVQTFTNADERLYGAIAQQASSVVYNRLLFNQTEEALSETAALYQASADLNAAQTFEEVLSALRQHTILGQGSHSVSISFFDRPWENDEVPPEEIQILAQWATTPAQGPDRYKMEHFPGSDTILRRDELVVFEDIAADDRFTETGRGILLDQLNARGYVYVPIVVAGQWSGFIGGLYPDKVSFSEEQLRRLNVLTRQAAVTIQSIRLYEQTQEALAQTEALYTGSERIVLASTEDEILQSLIQSTELRRLDRASLYMFDHPVEDSIPRDVSVVATWLNEGVPPSVQVGTRFEVARVPFLSTVNPDESFVINDIRNDPRVDEQTRHILEGYGMISFVMVPIVVGSQWLGMVSGTSSEPMNMTEVQMRQANSLVGQAAVVMQTTILFRQEQARARREHLLREIATKVRNSTDIDTIMQTAVTEIGRTLGRRSFIKLGNGQNGDAQAGDDQLSQTQTENGAS